LELFILVLKRVLCFKNIYENDDNNDLIPLIFANFILLMLLGAISEPFSSGFVDLDL
jgi:hypothetical protein